MSLRRPRLWLVAAAALVSLPLTSFLYLPALLRAGTLAPGSDSIAIPMAGSVVVAIVLAPIVFGLTALAGRRSTDATPLTAWDGTRPLRSAIISLVLGGPAIVLVVTMILELASTWLDRLWLVSDGLIAAWLLMIRAALIGDRDRTPRDVP